MYRSSLRLVLILFSVLTITSGHQALAKTRMAIIGDAGLAGAEQYRLQKSIMASGIK